MSDAAADHAAPPGPLGLWLALLAGPAAATLQLSVNYALVKWACANGGGWVLTVIAAALLAVSVGGGALGFRHLGGADAGPGVAPAWSAGSRRLLALMAIGLDVLVAIFLVNTLIALAVLTPCE